MMVIKKNLVFYMIAYWHDVRFKKQMGGPIKVYEIASNLTQLGHSVFLFIPKLGYPERQTSAYVVAIPFIDLPMLRFISFQVLAFLMSLWVMIQKGRPDVIYVRIMWSFLPMLLGKLFRTPVMLEVNDSPHRAYDKIKSGFKRRLVHLIDKISYCLSDHILPVTQKIADDLHRVDSISWNRMIVLPGGTNIDLFRPSDKSYCCAKLGLDLAKKYVGFIGTFIQLQGVDVLIDSASLIIKQYPDVRFLLVGDGPMKVTWEDKVAKMGLQDFFIFTGHVLYEYAPSYCGVMDICVSPLLEEATESSATKIFDYLACGKPIVLSDIAGSGKVFKSSGAVCLVPPEDPISLSQSTLQLLDNETLRDEMGKKGREFVVSKYDRKKIAKTVEIIAYQLCRKKL